MLILSVLILFISAWLDGISTIRAIKKGRVETDPLMVWVFGTNKPSAVDVYIRAAAVISLESFIALLFHSFYPSSFLFVAVAMLAQASIHIYEAIRNFKAV